VINRLALAFAIGREKTEFRCG